MTNPPKPVPDNGGENLKRNPLKGTSRAARIPIKVVPRADRLPKPDWLRVKAPTSAEVLRTHRLHTICEEAACPNLAELKAAHPHLPTKSGLMTGLGESTEEIIAVMHDLRSHGCELLTIGRYRQPSGAHLAVERYAHPDEFARIGQALGFRHVASGPLVRSSYHAERQAHGL